LRELRARPDRSSRGYSVYNRCLLNAWGEKVSEGSSEEKKEVRGRQKSKRRKKDLHTDLSPLGLGPWVWRSRKENSCGKRDTGSPR